jgi:hypothetical protein
VRECVSWVQFYTLPSPLMSLCYELTVREVTAVLCAVLSDRFDCRNDGIQLDIGSCDET